MAQIEIKNLTFKYAMADSSCLKNVSLNIENGDFVVVCGKSGCGKTVSYTHLDVYKRQSVQSVKMHESVTCESS